RGRADDAVGHGSVGHHRGGCGDLGADLEVFPDVLEGLLAEVIPYGRRRRYDVREIAAVRDDVVGALFGPEMLAPEIPARVHQLHCVERAAPAPWGTCGMRALAREGEE